MSVFLEALPRGGSPMWFPDPDASPCDDTITLTLFLSVYLPLAQFTPRNLPHCERVNSGAEQAGEALKLV